jgi:AcrR family transcriptional regulator
VNAARSRRSDAKANDERILDAVVDQVNAVGIDLVSAAGVAAAAGLGTGALYARYDSIDELLVDAWDRRCGPTVGGLVRRVVFVRRAGGPSDDLPHVAATLARPPAPLAAGLHMAMAARRIELLGDVVPGSVRHWLGELGLDRTGSDPSQALDLATATIAVGLASLGLVGDLERTRWTDIGHWLFGPAPAVAADRPTPRAQTTELVGDTDDPVNDALLRGAQAVVARSGVQRTTLARIGRAARLSATATYDRYASRDDLLVELVTQAAATIADPHRKAAVFTSPATLDAAVSALLVPVAQTRRRLFLEFLLASVHDPAVAAAYTACENASNAATAELLTGIYGSLDNARAMVGIAAAVNMGVAIFSELTEVLTEVDWRPVTEMLFTAAGGTSGEPPGGPSPG